MTELDYRELWLRACKAYDAKNPSGCMCEVDPDTQEIRSPCLLHKHWAAAAVAAERERCAKLCEEIAEKHLSGGRYVSVVADHSVRAGGQVDGAEECARAIRA